MDEINFDATVSQPSQNIPSVSANMPPRDICDYLTMKAKSVLKGSNKQTSLDYLNMAEPGSTSNLSDSLTAVWFWITLRGWDEMDNPQREIASYSSFRDKKG